MNSLKEDSFAPRSSSDDVSTAICFSGSSMLFKIVLAMLSSIFLSSILNRTAKASFSFPPSSSFSASSSHDCSVSNDTSASLTDRFAAFTNASFTTRLLPGYRAHCNSIRSTSFDSIAVIHFDFSTSKLENVCVLSPSRSDAMAIASDAGRRPILVPSSTIVIPLRTQISSNEINCVNCGLVRCNFFNARSNNVEFGSDLPGAIGRRRKYFP
mmetsp:Transcript_22630/g.35504  ORF Transcript_22630/g.35504 Transcript_22630/m.35504 type:complete len:212 (-) Transcript_22630:1093-1728(-)